MADPIYYDRGNVILGGAPIGDLESGSIQVQNGKQDIVTVNKGWAGVAKGALMGTITAKRFVPRAGFNKAQDLHEAVTKQKFIQAMVITGGKKYVVTGVPDGLGRDFGVSAASSEAFSLHGSIEITDL